MNTLNSGPLDIRSASPPWAEEDHQQMVQMLERQAEDLREVIRCKNEFLAMLAHELRNPLASVAHAVALLRVTEEADERAWAADVIARQTGQLARLIDDLLDVSRVGSGKIHLRKEPLDLAAVVDGAVEAALPLIAEHKHEFVLDCPRGCLFLNGDPARLEQIVLNLLSNAAKYTPVGGRISLRARREDDEVVLKVWDNGIGIATEKLPRIFDLFAQGERSLTGSEGGLGIGLAIVKKLIDLHGGAISACSAGAGAGSEFIVRLPAENQPPIAGPAREKDSPPAAEAAGHIRILVVDDSADSANTLARLLKKRGYQLEVASDGLEALATASAFHPDVILLDIGLPEMDGCEVAVRLRQDPRFRDIMLIAITGYGQEEDRKRCQESGFDHHLVKPFDLDHLQSLLSRPPRNPQSLA